MNIMEFGPKVLKAKIKEDWANRIAEQLGAHKGMPEGTRLDFHHANRLLSSDGFDEHEKATATNFLVGGVWDVPRLLGAGYILEPEEQRCQLCGQEVDSVEHRIFDCTAPAAKALRDNHLPHHMVAWLGGGSAVPYRMDRALVLREQRARDLAKQGLAIDPSVDQPPPPTTGCIREGHMDMERGKTPSSQMALARDPSIRDWLGPPGQLWWPTRMERW